jgi:hypothetical protein
MSWMPVDYKVVLCGRYAADESRVIVPHLTEHGGEDEEITGKSLKAHRLRAVSEQKRKVI